MLKYENIVNRSRPESERPKMSMHDRAAQFSPFAALNGHEDAINETARRVDKKTELSEEQKVVLDEKTRLISENPDSIVEVTYFVPDKRKEGGAYVTVSGLVIKIDTIERKLIMSDRTTILLDDVLEINSDLFNKFYE